MLYLLCPDLIARSTHRTALHHTRVSRASPSTQPRQCPPFPSLPFTSLPSSAVPSQQLPHNVLTMLPPLSTAALHSLRSADPLPTAVKPPKPWNRAGKTDRMANQIMQWHSRYSEGLFFLHTLQYVRKNTTHAYLRYPPHSSMVSYRRGF